MKVVARRIEGYAHEIDLEGGHELVVDEPADRGGTDTGPRPTQLLATSLAGCTAITIEMYADRKGWDVGRLEVDVEMDYEGPVPNSFAVAISLPAELSQQQRHRLLAIATRCPVHKVLAGEASVTVTERLEAA
ncbi:MAG: putative redox protein [Solirubrobacterales bacterium]|nr:putative redox protein [Solirubrobacterales bacterium]